MIAGPARAPLSVTGILDDTVIVVSAAAPWSAIEIATALPYRFLQVVFIERLVELGGNATHYANALGRLATITVLALLVSLPGRAVWIRAAGLAQKRDVPRAAAVLHVAPAALLSYVFTSALIATLFYSISITLIAIPLLIVVSGLAAGTMELNERPSLLEPLRLIRRYAKHTRLVVALLMVFSVAFVVAAVNLFAVFSIGLWLAHAFATAGVARWDVLLGFSNRHFIWLLLAGALVAVEPFWIAANVVLVRKAGAAESGDDLRHRLEELTAQ